MHIPFSSSVELRSTTAAVAIAAFTLGMTAAFGTSDVEYAAPTAEERPSKPRTRDAECGTLVECRSERECYDRIAACIADGGEWRGDEKAGRCHTGTR